MVRTSVFALSIVLASGGAAFARSSPDSGPPKPPPKPGQHRHAPPPPSASRPAPPKEFVIQLGSERLSVKCGNESLKSCVQDVQPLIQKLRSSSTKKQ